MHVWLNNEIIRERPMLRYLREHVFAENQAASRILLDSHFGQENICNNRYFVYIKELTSKMSATLDQSHLFEYEIFGTPLMYHPKLTMGYTDWYQLVRSCKIQDSYTSPTFLQSSYNSHIIIEYSKYFPLQMK